MLQWKMECNLNTCFMLTVNKSIIIVRYITATKVLDLFSWRPQFVAFGRTATSCSTPPVLVGKSIEYTNFIWKNFELLFNSVNWQKEIFLSFFLLGGLWLCQEDWVWEEDVDLLRDAWVCSTRDHSEQGPRHLSWLLVSRNPHVWALNWQVHTSLGMSMMPYLSSCVFPVTIIYR